MFRLPSNRDSDGPYRSCYTVFVTGDHVVVDNPRLPNYTGRTGVVDRVIETSLGNEHWVVAILWDTHCRNGSDGESFYASSLRLRKKGGFAKWIAMQSVIG